MLCQTLQVGVEPPSEVLSKLKYATNIFTGSLAYPIFRILLSGRDEKTPLINSFGAKAATCHHIAYVMLLSVPP